VYIGIRVKYPLFFSNVNKGSIFSTDFRKILKYPNFMKILLFGAELFHSDGQKDTRDKANIPFSTIFKMAYNPFLN
jgi:hypothetical protein